MVDKQTSKIVKDLFATQFVGFDFALDSSRKRMLLKSDDDRVLYYSQAKRLMESDFWKEEIGGVYRSLMSALALKAETELERMSYRVCLLFIQEWQNQLIQLAVRSESPVDKSAAGIDRLDEDE